jgi:hypothetical protein
VAPQWEFKPGDQIRRKDLHLRFGGNPRSGISPSTESPNVFIFSDPKSGEPHGYYDDWLEANCFHYTGEGKRGDQEMKAGNAAILNHVAKGRALRVFEGAGGVVTYVDEFELDDVEPFYRRDAHATNRGQNREVIVFRLRPKTVERPAVRSETAEVLAGPARTDIAVEQQWTERVLVTPGREPFEAERREQKLVLAFEGHLRGLGHELCRQRLRPPGESQAIETDLFDLTTGLLVEAKGTTERGSIRMAIGQLADYRRFFEEGTLKHVAVLLPREPRRDLCDLLLSQQVDLIYPTGSGFEDSRGGALVSE